VRSGRGRWVGSRGWVEFEFADEFAGVFGDDADAEFVNEHEDADSGPVVSDADVVQAAVVAQGEFAVAVDAVFADSEVLADVDALAAGMARGRAFQAVAGVCRWMLAWGRCWL